MLTAPVLVQAEGAPSEILLRGVLQLGERQMFSLSESGGAAAKWVKLGQAYHGYRLVSYDSETQSLRLEKDAEVLVLGLEAAKQDSQGEVEARLAEATELMELLQFEQMMDDTMDAQMKAVSGMMRQQMKQLGPDGSVDEELLAFQTKAIGEMFEGIDWEPIKAGMAQAYADVFTEDELRGLSNFYTTPAGQASIEKMPELQAKTMEVMMPSIMEASQSMQQKMIKFISDRRTAEAKKSQVE